MGFKLLLVYARVLAKKMLGMPKGRVDLLHGRSLMCGIFPLNLFDVLILNVLSIIYHLLRVLVGLTLLIFLRNIESHSLRRMGTPGPGPWCGLNLVLSDHYVD